MNSTTALADEELSAFTALTANLSAHEERIVKHFLKGVHSMTESVGPDKTIAALDTAIEINAAAAASQATFHLYLM